MRRMPTTDAQVHTAQDAYDRAAAEAARITRELTEAIEARALEEIDELVARSMVAIAQREYAWSLLVTTIADRAVSAVSA